MLEAPTYLPVDEPVTIPRTPKRAKSDSVITSAPRVVPGPGSSDVAPLPPPPVVAVGSAPEMPRPSMPMMSGQPPIVPLPGGGFSFDPHAVPLPPELATNVYSWLRRLALQADLAGADRLLRDALVDLTSALSVVLIYAGPDGLHSLGTDDELPPADAQAPIQAVARSRRALVSSHSALVPISTSNETICVIQLTRNAHQNPFTLVEQVVMAAIARESSGIMHHLVVEHLQRRTEAESDKKSLYRPEALESHRRRGHEGVIAELSPGWVRRTYHVLSATMVIAIVFGIVVKVPTYSSGTGVIVYDGAPVTAPSAGTIDKIFVLPGQEVHQGDLLVKLSSEKEDADLAQAKATFDKQQEAFLFDRSDETVRKQFVEAEHQYNRLQAAVAQRTIRASKDGTVSDLLLTVGSPVQFGDHLMTIIEPGTKPEVWAFLPASDLPRLHAGQQKLQVELLGYTKTREQVTITEVSRNAMGAAEARRTLGPILADAAKLEQNGSYVLVKAQLTSSTFEAEHKIYRYHHGLPAKTEVKVESKRFVVTLLPSLEKYL